MDRTWDGFAHMPREADRERERLRLQRQIEGDRAARRERFAQSERDRLARERAEAELARAAEEAKRAAAAAQARCRLLLALVAALVAIAAGVVVQKGDAPVVLLQRALPLPAPPLQTWRAWRRTALTPAAAAAAASGSGESTAAAAARALLAHGRCTRSAMLSVSVIVANNAARAKLAVCALAPGAAGEMPPFVLGRPCGGRAELALVPDARGSDGDDTIVNADAFSARLQAELPASALTAAGLGALLVVIENHNDAGAAPGPSLDADIRVSAASNRAAWFWLWRADAWLRRGAAALRPSASGAAAAAINAVQSAAEAAAGALRELFGRVRGPAKKVHPADAAWQWLTGGLGASASDPCYAAARSPATRALARECLSLRASLDLRDSVSRDLCNSLLSGNVIVPALLAANVLAFLSGGRLQGELVLGRPTARTLVLYQFEHADVYHILGNMGTLLVVGDEVFAALGCSSLVFFAWYLACGVGAGLFASLTTRAGTRLVGASGAITGIMMTLAILAPNAAVSIIPGVDVGSPLVWAVGSALRDIAQNAAFGRNVSWQAHFGGFMTGLMLSYAWLAAAA